MLCARRGIPRSHPVSYCFHSQRRVSKPSTVALDIERFSVNPLKIACLAHHRYSDWFLASFAPKQKEVNVRQLVLIHDSPSTQPWTQDLFQFDDDESY